MFNQFHLSLEGGVEVVLDVIVGPTWQVLCDLRPSIAQFPVCLDNHQVLFVSPLVLLNVRVQVIVPPMYISHEMSVRSIIYLSLHCLPILPGRAVAI
jgi:hypothetical protein